MQQNAEPLAFWDACSKRSVLLMRFGLSKLLEKLRFLGHARMPESKCQLPGCELPEWTSRISKSRHCAFLGIGQCSFVYPYPNASDLVGGNSDHGPRKTRTKTHTTPDSVFKRERRNSDHGLSFWGGELRPWSEFGCFWGRGRRGGSRVTLKNLKLLDNTICFKTI